MENIINTDGTVADNNGGLYIEKVHRDLQQFFHPKKQKSSSSMPEFFDDLDIVSLHSNPNAFILQCQNLVKIFVKKYISSGMFSRDEEEDIIQSVNEALIRKLPSIKAQYDGRSLLQTYIGSVIQHICLDINRSQQRQIESVEIPEDDRLLVAEQSVDIFLKDQLERFHVIMEMFGGNKTKLLFCLKILYRFLITEEEIDQLFPNLFDKYKAQLMKFTKPYEAMYVERAFEIAVAAFNKMERKDVHWDSLRRWTQKNAKRIIHLMNGNPPVHAYNEDSLKIILEEYAAMITKFEQ